MNTNLRSSLSSRNLDDILKELNAAEKRCELLKNKNNR